MNSNQFRILVALVARGDEKPVIKQAALFAEKFNATLIAIHVNQPALSQPKGEVQERVTEDILRKIFIKNGFEYMLDDVDFIIEHGESISKIINKYTDNLDLVILGHRKQTTFKSQIMDSIDEGISNLVSCPVLVVQKN